MKLSYENKQEETNNEGCGKHFFHFLPMVLGLIYGILERGAILKIWWFEAILAAKNPKAVGQTNRSSGPCSRVH